MQRFQAVERPKETRHAGLRTYDIRHVWPNGEVRNGVKWTSEVHVYILPAAPDSFSKQVQIAVWVPGGEVGVAHDLVWGADWWVAIPDWGTVSIVSLNDVPLDVFWELTAGKE